MSFFPDTVCWRLTSHCNRQCPFCYRPNTSDMSTSEALKVIDLLSEMGCERLGITGGEPLSKQGIDQILKHAKSKGFKICLATNSDFFSSHREAVFDCVDAVGLPIESTDSKIHNSLRGQSNLGNVKATIRDIVENSKLPLYFTTVATSRNVSELGRIESFLAGLGKRVIFWKVYELVDYIGRKQRLVGLKTDAKIEVGGLLGEDKVFYLPAAKRCRTYFLVNPDGDVIIPKNVDGRTEDMTAGNLLLDSPEKILSVWRKETDYEGYKCHLCALKKLV